MTPPAGLQRVGFAVFMALAASPAEGQDEEAATGNEMFEFDNNEPPSTDNRLAPDLFWGGEVEVSWNRRTISTSTTKRTRTSPPWSRAWNSPSSMSPRRISMPMWISS